MRKVQWDYFIYVTRVPWFLAPPNSLFLFVIIIFGKQNLNVTIFHNYTSNLIIYCIFFGQLLDEYNKDKNDNNYIFYLKNKINQILI